MAYPHASLSPPPPLPSSAPPPPLPSVRGGSDLILSARPVRNPGRGSLNRVICGGSRGPGHGRRGGGWRGGSCSRGPEALLRLLALALPSPLPLPFGVTCAKGGGGGLGLTEPEGLGPRGHQKDPIKGGRSTSRAATIPAFPRPPSWSSTRLLSSDTRRAQIIAPRFMLPSELCKYKQFCCGGRGARSRRFHRRAPAGGGGTAAGNDV